jgi:predicted permease
MSIGRQIARGLGALFNRKRAQGDVAEQVENYLELSAADFEARGMSPGEARRAARLEIGSPTGVRDQVQSSGWEQAVAEVLSDLRHAARRLGKTPGFTAVSVLTLALGIGASAAIFSVIEGVLLKPLPYPESGRIVALRHTAPGIHIDDLNLAASLYLTYSEENHVFQDVGMWLPDSWTVTGLGETEQVAGLSVTHGFLAALDVRPALGRSFTLSDEDPGGEHTVMLTDAYWKSHFGGDRSALGRRLQLNGDGYTVIGVLPPAFEFLDRKISLVAPFRFRRADINLVSFCCEGIARLKPGVTLDQANADVGRMLALAPLKFRVNPGFSADVWSTARIAPRVRYLKDSLVGDIGRTLWVLMGTVGMVLLIACANIANLLLVRADGRRQELAVRAALGAGWGRIARELLLESLCLGVAGGALGLALGYGALRLLSASGLEQLPRARDIAIDPVVLAFTVGISLASSLLFGIIPVLKYARPRLWNTLGSGGRTLSESRDRHRARGLLVVVQVALAMVLLVGSGLLIRTFRALRNVDPGFAGGSEIETLRTDIPDSQAKEPEGVIRVEEAILHNLRAIPGVSAAAIIDSLPMDGGSNDPVYAQDYPGAAVPPIRRFKYVSPGYFAATGARLVAGRDVTWAEAYNQTPVALVSENMARELWRDPRAAIGKRIRPTLKDDWRQVIGVVADLHDNGLDQTAPGIVYWPLLEKNFESSPSYVIRGPALVIRTPRAGTASLLQDIQRAVAGVNSNLPVSEVDTLQSLYNASLARTSFTLLLLAIAGGMAMFLGLIGLYGVLSYSVAQRTREIGIRLALGAPLREVTRLFVRHGLVLSGMGAAGGLIAALLLTRLIKSLLYDVSPADPSTYAGVTAALILAAGLASYLPARKAARVDPMTALRAE